MLGEFAINTGRGALTLILGAILYQETGGLWAFALAFLSDFIVALFIQGIAGAAVDRFGPGKVLNLSLGISSLLLFACWVLISQLSSTALFIFSLAVLLNIFRPFIRTAVFALLPALFSQSELEKANGAVSLAFQVGQFAGMALAALSLELGTHGTAIFTVLMAFVVSTASYLMISAKYLNLRVRSDVKSKIISWRAFTEVLAHATILRGCMIGSVDYALIAVFNLLLAPVVAHNFDNLSRWLGILDGAFALGAILAGVFVIKQSKDIGLKYRYSLLAHVSAALLFLGYALQWHAYLILLLVLLFGLSTTVSVVMWNTALQKSSPEAMHGRVASVKYIFNTLAVTLAIACVSFANEQSFLVATYAAVTTAAVCFVLAFVLMRYRSSHSLSLSRES